jgi:KDEL-tailed cysteine endopeptidase
MRTGFATLAVVGVAACVAMYALSSAPSTTNLYHAMTADEMEFVKYVAKYGKSYGTKEEFEYRAQLFKDTLVALSSENSKNGNSFTVGTNLFADWSREEYRSILGYRPRSGVRNFSDVTLQQSSLPSEIDWRNNGAVNGVKDQKQCGSCWAFSGISASESRWKIKSGNLLSLSEQQVVDCAKGSPYGSEGCNGGWMDDVFTWGKNNGFTLESDYPYKGYD